MKTKKLLAMLLTLMMVVGMLPLAAVTAAATGETVIDFTASGLNHGTGLLSATVDSEVTYSVYKTGNDTCPTYQVKIQSNQPSINISFVSSPKTTDNGSMYASQNGTLNNVSNILATKNHPMVSSDPICIRDGDTKSLYSNTYNGSKWNTTAIYEFTYTNTAFKITQEVGVSRTVCSVGAQAEALTVAATDPDGKDITYRWQASADGVSFADVAGATDASYTPPTGTAGKTMYRVQVSNGVTTLTSGAAVIDVQAAGSPSPEYALKRLLITSEEDPEAGTVYLDAAPWTSNDLEYTIILPETMIATQDAQHKWKVSFYLRAENFKAGEKLRYYYIQNGSSSSSGGAVTPSYSNTVESNFCKAYYMKPGYEPVAKVRVGPDAEKTLQATKYTEYILHCKLKSVLSSLTLDVPSSPAFTPEVFAYTAEVPSNLESIELRATALTETNAISVNGSAMTGGTATVPIAWGSGDTMTVTVQVGTEDPESAYVPGTYTLTLKKAAPAEKPVISAQPASATYADTETNPAALSVSATCTDAMSYQWYRSATAAGEGEAISGATGSSYTPTVSQIAGQSETAYYYCVVTNTAKGLRTFSDAAAVTLYADPTPYNAKIVLADGSDPAAEYTYAQGAEDAVTLKAVCDNRNTGGTYTYLWSSSTYEPGVAVGRIDQQTFTPSTAAKNQLTLKCTVTCEYEGRAYSAETANTVSVFINPNTAKAPKIDSYIIRSRTIEIGDPVLGMSLTASSLDAGELSYQWYAMADGAEDWTAIPGATEAAYQPPAQTAPCAIFYYCKVTNTVTDYAGNTFTASIDSDYALYTFVAPKVYNVSFEGDGTEASPWLIKGLEDLQALQSYVNTDGMSFEKCYFKFDLSGGQGISLPADWVPIGTSKTRFGGCIDGDGALLTVAPDGLPLLGFVRRCTVKNLDIYGERIASYGLVQYYDVDYGPTGDYGDYSQTDSTTINIINVTLKRGTQTLKSGFIGGYASGINYVNITGCTVEEGVVIGYDHAQKNIGSFAGDFNGTVTDSVSYATVFGTNRVGGLVGTKGQSMGPCDIYDSEFHGSVVATGKYAGGILGSGYDGGGTAPNTPCVIIQDCLVTGSVAGAENVGGILGGEPEVVQAWKNGIGRIQNNLFVGSIQSDGTNVGGVIGYMNSMNRYTVVGNNFYASGCGADKGVGKIAWVDNTSAQHGRSDDPAGADAEKLAAAATTAELADGTVLQKLNTGENSSGTWVQGTAWPERGAATYLRKIKVSGYQSSYTTDKPLDFDTLTVTATNSDGTTEKLTSGVTYSGYQQATVGYQTITASYTKNGIVYTDMFEIQVFQGSGGGSNNSGNGGSNSPSGEQKITVYFQLLGDHVHDSDADGEVHTLINGGLEEWLPRQAYSVDDNATVWELIQIALEGTGITCSNPSGNYVKDMTRNGVTIGEFTNGRKSGWMYTLNGKHPLLGVSEQTLHDGDVIVWHYTDDYTIEEGSDKWEAPASTGDSTKKEDNKTEETAGVTLSAEDVKTAAEEGKGLEVKTENGTVKVDADTVKALAENGADVTVDVKANEDGTTTFEVTSGGEAVEGKVKVELPATGADQMLVIVGADGTEAPVILSASEDGVVYAEIPAGATVKVVDAEPMEFDDVKADDWFAEAVEFVTSHGIFQGTDQGFEPGTTMNRAMLAMVLYRISGETAPEGGAGFGDVPADAWFADAVAWAADAGIVNGRGEGFAPDAPVTREEIATMLYRFAQYLGVDVSGSADLAQFPDGGETSSWAGDAMAWAVSVGLFQGDDTGALNPGGEATRAEVATLVERLVKLMVK